MVLNKLIFGFSDFFRNADTGADNAAAAHTAVQIIWNIPINILAVSGIPPLFFCIDNKC